MKTLTCAQMGGMCETAVSAETRDELMQKGMAHVEEAHPDMAASIKSMSLSDPLMVEWQHKFDKTWEETPEA